ncbi:MAG: hypothetical protein RLZZ292_286 [Bacteroidota bacterium]|jgi:hypothetical protein
MLAGAARKANVGMSNDKTDEKSVRRKPKVSNFYANQRWVSRDLRIIRKEISMESELIFLHLYMFRWSDG